MEKTIFKRFLQLLGSKGGIVFEIIGDKVGLASCLYNKITLLCSACMNHQRKMIVSKKITRDI